MDELVSIIRRIEEWCISNQMSLNKKKCGIFLIQRKFNKDKIPLEVEGI